MAQPLDLRSRAQGTGGDRHEGFVAFLGTARPFGAQVSRPQEPSAAASWERGRLARTRRGTIAATCLT